VGGEHPRDPPPPRDPTFGRPPFDVVRRTQRLLRPDHQLADLVGEPAELQERAEDRPALGVLAVEELANPGELLRCREDGGGRVVPEPLEPPPDDRERGAAGAGGGRVAPGRPNRSPTTWNARPWIVTTVRVGRATGRRSRSSRRASSLARREPTPSATRSGAGPPRTSRG